MSYKIALTSSDDKNIDWHFGEAKYFLVVQVDESTGNYQVLEKRTFGQYSESISNHCHDGEFLKNLSELIDDCVYLLTAKIGNHPHRVLQDRNVTCIEAPFLIAEAIPKINDYYLSHKERENHAF